MNILYICEKEKKEQLIINNQDLIPGKFMTIDELLEELTISIDKEAYPYLLVNHQMKTNIVKSYLDYLPYYSIFNDNIKCKKVLEIKELLDKEHLIVYNDDILRLNEVYIHFYDYNINDKKIGFILNILNKNNINYQIHESKINQKQERTVYCFDKTINESRFLFNNIKELLDKGIDYQKIKIANYTDNYEFDFNRLSKYYQIPIKLNKDKNIIYKPICQRLFSLLSTHDNYFEIMEILEKEFPGDLHYNKIIRIINDYNLSKYEPNKTIDIFKMEFINASFDKVEYEKAIEIIDLAHYPVKEDEYIFYLGFNTATSPFILKDDAYFDDQLLSELNLNTSRLENHLSKMKLINKLNSNTNLVISFSKKSYFESFILSNLFSELGYKENNSIKEIDLLQRSEKEDVLILAYLMDMDLKFDLEIDNYHKIAFDINFNDYNYKRRNQYTKLDEELIKKFISEKTKLSASALMKYYECPFKYYLTYILRLDTFDSTTSKRVGDYAHALLKENAVNINKIEDTDYLKMEVNKHDKVELTSKDVFFYNLMEKMINDLIEFNKESLEESKFNDELVEINDEVLLQNGNLVFNGTIDKILFRQDDEECHLIIVDYKTYKKDLKLELIQEGINIQLPIYLYLIKNGEKCKSKISNIKVIGLFYQNILMKKYTERLEYKNKETYTFKLDGKYIKDSKIVEEYIQKDYYIANEKRELEEDELDYYEQTIDKLINGGYEKIMEANFKIEPKKDEKDKDFSCQYCSFKDICYRTNRDYKVIKGGENNGME